MDIRNGSGGFDLFLGVDLQRAGGLTSADWDAVLHWGVGIATPAHAALASVSLFRITRAGVRANTPSASWNTDKLASICPARWPVVAGRRAPDTAFASPRAAAFGANSQLILP